MDAEQIRAELEAADRDVTSDMTSAEFSARCYGYWLRSVIGALGDPDMSTDERRKKFERFRDARDAFVRWRTPA